MQQTKGGGGGCAVAAEDFDVIVVGAGIIGSACAYYLARSGLSTLLLEQFELGHARGSSHGASRIIRHTHSSEVFIPLAVDAYREWNELEATGGQQLYTRNGLLWLCDNLGETIGRSDLLRKHSIRHEVLKGREIRARFPHLRYDRDEDETEDGGAPVDDGAAQKWSAVWEPGGGTILAAKCLATFHKLASDLPNCTICANERVAKFVVGGDDGAKSVALLTTHSGRKFTARRRVVVAAGAWLEKLFADLPLRVRPQRVRVNFWRVAADALPRFQRADAASPNLIITQRSDDTEMFMIPCADYPDKVKPLQVELWRHLNRFGIHVGVEECDPDSASAAAAAASEPGMPSVLREILSRHIRAHLPDVEASAPAVEANCFYSMTDDHNFIVDSHPSQPNVIIAGGMSGTGFKFAPIIAKIVAKMVAEDDNLTNAPIPEFRLNRQIPQGISCKL